MRRRPVQSSALQSVGYDRDRQVLEIAFKEGGIYQYLDLPAGLFERFMAADSLGSFFQHHIRNQFPTRRVG